MEYTTQDSRSQQRNRGGPTKRDTVAITAVVVLLAVAVIALVGVPFARAADPTLPIDKVTPGMVGYAKTVATGTVITTFTVQVVGVLTNESGFPAGNLIVFRASGPLIDQTGGIVMGMSGSPVYLKDPDDDVYKIAGAVAYGDSFVDPKLAMATPIDEMLGMLSVPGMMPMLPKAQTRYVPADGNPLDLGGGRTLSSAVIGEGTTRSVAPGTVTATKLAPIISVSGISPSSRGFSKLRDALRAKGFTATAGMGSSRSGPDVSTATVEPGSVLGAALVTGDATIAGMGTTTYVDGTKVLGFGHPMFWQGATNFAMTTGYIHTIWASDAGFGYKIGSAGDTTGTIVQDRSKGIAGKVGQTPAESTLTVDAENATEGTSTSRTFRLAQGALNVPKLGADLGAVVAANTNDIVFEDAAGTADITYTIAGTTATGDSFSLDWSDKLFDRDYVGGAAVDDFSRSLETLLDNEFEDVTITAMSYSSRMTRDRDTARIVGASLLGKKITPGTTITVRTYVVPYNSDTTQSVDVTIAIPARFPANAMLTIETGDSQAMGPSEGAAGSVADLVAELEDRMRGNELLVTLEPDGGDGPIFPWRAVAPQPLVKQVATSWVMSGELQKNTSQITMAASPSTVTYGSRVRFYGTVADLSDPYHSDEFDARPQVQLWAKPTGSSAGAVVATGYASQSTGVYSISYAPTSTGSFWTRFVGDDNLLDAKSIARRATVRGRVTLSVSDSTVRLGGSAVLSGGVRPSHAGSTVFIERFVSGTGWVRMKTRTLDGGSNYAWTWSPPARRGTFWVRARWAGDANHAAGTSSARKVIVY